jgi:hypothetical protein
MAASMLFEIKGYDLVVLVASALLAVPGLARRWVSTGDAGVADRPDTGPQVRIVAPA